MVVQLVVVNAFGVQSRPVNRTVAVRWAPFASAALQSTFVQNATQASQDATVTGRSDAALLVAGNTAQLLNVAAASPAGFYNGNTFNGTTDTTQDDRDRAQAARATQRQQLLDVVSQVQSYETSRPDTLQAIAAVVTAIVDCDPQELSAATQKKAISILTPLASGGGDVNNVTSAAVVAALAKLVAASQAAGGGTVAPGSRRRALLQASPPPPPRACSQAATLASPTANASTTTFSTNLFFNVTNLSPFPVQLTAMQVGLGIVPTGVTVYSYPGPATSAVISSQTGWAQAGSASASATGMLTVPLVPPVTVGAGQTVGLSAAAANAAGSGALQRVATGVGATGTPWFADAFVTVSNGAGATGFSAPSSGARNLVMTLTYQAVCLVRRHGPFL